MAYDAATSTVVMFGGIDADGNPLGDTWLWNGTSWAQAAGASGPSPRTGAGMAYDAADKTVFLFGGSTASGLVNEIWAWDGSSWSRRDFSSSPSPRTSPAMAYDSKTASIVLFGGSSSNGLMGDTWTWNGNDWTQQAPGSSPSARAFANMAYFAPGGTAVLFGGFDGSAVDGDTWNWDGMNWTPAAPAVTPPARYLSAMDYDAASGTIEMFSGISSAGAVNDSWSWNGSTWTQRSFGTAPVGRVQHALVYDAATRSMLLFGGQTQAGGSVSRLNDTWNLPLGSLDLGSVAIGQSSTSAVSFTIASAGTLGAPLVVTGGTQGLDFTSVAGSTCTGAVTAGQSCVVNVTFTPQYAGTRMGAVELTSSTGAVVATTMLQGTGQGAQITFSSGLITTVAGNGTPGFLVTDEGAPATSAELMVPYGITVDAGGNLYFADSSPNRVRKIIAATGTIVTVAGNGARNYHAGDDGGPATAASLWLPSAVKLDGAGNLYIVDRANSRIRLVSASTGIITTVAGNGSHGYLPSDDGIPATLSRLNFPAGIAVDGAGNMYIADTGNNRIRKVSASGIISTYAGNGTPGYVAAQDGGAATSASLKGPNELALDAAGNLFIADTGNARIRRVDAVTGVISTVAGNGVAGYNAADDGGPAVQAQLSNPLDVACDAAGNLFIADQASNRVRKVAAATNVITTVAGTGASAYGLAQDGGPVSSANASVFSLALDGAGDLFLSDASNYRIRKVATRGTLLFPTATAVGSIDGTDGTQTLTVNNSGNLPLSISAFASSSSNFNLAVPGVGSCTTWLAIAPGDSCMLGAQFTPQSGSGVLNATLNLTSNVPNAIAPPAPLLSGSTAAGTISFLIPHVDAKTTAPTKLSIILTYSSAAVPTGTLSISVGGSTTGVGTWTCVLKGGHQNCTVPFDPSSYAAGTYTISAGKAGDANYGASTGTGTITILWGATPVGGPMPVTPVPVTPVPVTAVPVAGLPLSGPLATGSSPQ